METLFIQADELLERLTLEALEARDDFTARVALSRFHAQRGDYDRQLTVLEGLPDAAELLGIALAEGAFRAGGAQRTWMAQRALDQLTDVTWRSRLLVLLDRVDEALDALRAAGQNAEALLLAAPRQRWKVVRACARRLVPADAEKLVSAARGSCGRLGALYLGLAARFYPELRQERSWQLMEREARRLPYGPERALVFVRFQMLTAEAIDPLAAIAEEHFCHLASQNAAALRSSLRLLESRAPRFASSCPKLMARFRDVLEVKLAREEAMAASRDPELAGPVRELVVLLLRTNHYAEAFSASRERLSRLETSELRRSLERIRSRYVHFYLRAHPLWQQLEQSARVGPLDLVRRLTRFLRRDPWER